MDVVIPFRHSRNKDEELRYALRSISRFVPDLGNVYVIGDLPRWKPRNIIHVEGTKDKKRPDYQEFNIARKLLVACNIPELSDDFIYQGDDVYLLQNFDGSYYYKGPVWDGNGAYAKTEDNTIDYLAQWCISNPVSGNINNFNVHTPRIFNKEKLIKVISALDWSKRYGYQINTCYAVMNNIEGVCIEHVKFKSCIRWELLIQRYCLNKKVFSIQDGAWKPDMKKLLNIIYPEKSIYEN